MFHNDCVKERDYKIDSDNTSRMYIRLDSRLSVLEQELNVLRRGTQEDRAVITRLEKQVKDLSALKAKEKREEAMDELVSNIADIHEVGGTPGINKYRIKHEINRFIRNYLEGAV